VNKQALQTEAAEMRKRLDEIDRLLKDNEYPDGTPGWFLDSNENRKIFGYLKNGEPANYAGIFGTYRYRRYYDQELSECAGAYANFEPLKEAIPPIWIEHDGGKYPGDENDFVLAKYMYGEVWWPAHKHHWENVHRYQVIRRAK